MKKTKSATITLWVSLVMLALLGLITFSPNTTYAEQAPPPCHPNPNAAQDVAAVSGRGDIVNLPDLLHHARHPRVLASVHHELEQISILLIYLESKPFHEPSFQSLEPKKSGESFLTPPCALF